MKKLIELERFQLEQGCNLIARVLQSMKIRRLNKRELERMKLLEEAVINCEAVWMMK